ncbi:hypothetical protein RF11_15582 [Thelohanellus kitauei]|uniref:Uncharacterized protein n=1 Tax=Thelohanellus kitauei TaxID=669202 RepID=A0A0C2M2L5_THEKT|nr:hypothetical protein RF11_15582 [Thelohanellus kitauei]
MGIVYRYDNSKSSFIQVNLTVSGNITNADKILPVGDKMLCFLYSRNISFYLDEQLKIDHIQAVDAAYEYLPSSQQANLIARIKKISHVSVIIVIIFIPQPCGILSFW